MLVRRTIGPLDDGHLLGIVGQRNDARLSVHDLRWRCPQRLGVDGHTTGAAHRAQNPRMLDHGLWVTGCEHSFELRHKPELRSVRMPECRGL